VPISWTETRSEFKSPLRVVARSLWLSREGKTLRCRQLKERLDEAEWAVAQRGAVIDRQRDEINALKEKVWRLECQRWRPPQSSCCLSDDPPLKGHKFGVRMIGLAVNLARVVGLRPAARVLRIFWQWLGLPQQLPDWATIRTWLLRVGLAALQEPVVPADDWIWMADHSNQIGPEKTLGVVGVRASQLPPRGETLQHEHLHLLTVQPGTHWKREDMKAVYSKLAERYGVPRAVLCDGAVELRDGVESLQNKRSDTIVLQDFKHKAAIFFKAAVGDHPRFAAFQTQLAQTRAAIQQTELAYLTPPSQKPKARFMNMAPTLNWASTVLWLLENPHAKSRRWSTADRLEEKLGWLRSFAAELRAWRECQQVVQTGVTFINEQGLWRGAGAQLAAAFDATLDARSQTAAQHLAQRLVDFVTAAEDLLQPGERLPMSTEILESTFALYKQLERQHSKGGFTSLLAAFGALLKPPTDADIRRAFATVSVKDVDHWTRANLGTTLTSKRLATYKEFRSATKLAAAT
jgi:hypothetical protein